jgi:hypothetical protein
MSSRATRLVDTNLQDCNFTIQSQSNITFYLKSVRVPFNSLELMCGVCVQEIVPVRRASLRVLTDDVSRQVGSVITTTTAATCLMNHPTAVRITSLINTLT